MHNMHHKANALVKIIQDIAREAALAAMVEHRATKGGRKIIAGLKQAVAHARNGSNVMVATEIADRLGVNRNAVYMRNRRAGKKHNQHIMTVAEVERWEAERNARPGKGRHNGHGLV